ncbi:hypothetical protein DRJ17_00785 [Candidatus Woesearchaeota archaeon]|nr:MAG: hypothetical protein DRJ17_00785 [Candidatus Woesearchaeota archaeon]
MVTVQEKMDAIESGPNYVHGSLIIKSYDDRGVVLKWLEQSSGVAERKEHFIELNEDESNMPLENRTAVNDIEIEPPSG